MPRIKEWRTAIRLRAGSIALALALSVQTTGGAAAQSVSAAQARGAAETLAQWAMATGNRAVLASALDLALRSGASLDPEDPWSMRAAADRLAAAGGEVTRLAQQEDPQSRGVIAGFSRLDMTLEPGESRDVPLTMAGGEAAIVEARLKRGSEGADLDLRLTGPDGVLAEDTGPDTGTQGVGAYVEFWTEKCIEVEVEIRNIGDAVANAVMLAPASSVIGCRM